MKRIGLYLGCAPSWGGAFQYALSILQTLSDLDKQQIIHLSVVYEDKSWEPILQHQGVQDTIHGKVSPIIRGGIFRIWRNLKLPISLWRRLTPFFHPTVRTLLKTRSDLIFFPSQDQMSYFGPYNAATSIHDLMHRYESFPENTNESSFRDFNYGNIYRFSRKVLVDSKVGKGHVIECYGAQGDNKIEVLPYITPYYLEEKTPDDSIFSRFGIPDDFLFYPAQFWKHKNHSNLIRAFALLKKKYPKLGLVLSGGKNNASEEVERMIRDFNLVESVFMVGYVNEEEIIALYKKSRCLVMPTFFGPTNIPPLEALSLGTEVVYSKIYAYEEFLGDSAFFVDPKDPKDIASGVERILIGERKNQLYDSQARRKAFYEKVKEICIMPDDY